MSEYPESGPPQFSRMIAVGLQALTAACLISWLVLSHRRRAIIPEYAQCYERTNDESLATKEDNETGSETANELVWIGNETNTADEPVPFGEDPFRLLHFRIRPPAGHSSEPSFEVYPPHITREKATKWFRETWRACLIIIAVVVSFIQRQRQPVYLAASGRDNNIYAAFHTLPSPQQTISELCGQLSFMSSSTSGANTRASAGGADAREIIAEACDAADKNLDQFDSDWADLLSYSSRGWLKRLIQELYSAGYNTSRSGIYRGGIRASAPGATCAGTRPPGRNARRVLCETMGWLRLYSWWTGDETASGYGSAATGRAAKEAARLHHVVKAFQADVTESVRRVIAIESSLDMLEQKVTALAPVKKPRQGRTAVSVTGLDAAWAALAWRADCGCDGETQTSPIRAAATPVIVAYFVPSAETLFQGMKKTYRLLAEKQASAIRRREGASAEKERTSHTRWHEYSLEHGGAAAVDEEGCLDMSVDENGSRKCLRLNQAGARVRSRLQVEFGADGLVGIEFGRGGAEEPLLDG
ncbi:hypothetical protein B0I37DRAFT_348624 [Chaetomium sp. MPI-CAGE-AT-0009]|nr:hypothetical protein B0I37DRAFT_348624 [Chaetomium sp. MPI-CAGE-AT-0009]